MTHAEVENFGDFICDKCHSPLWVTWPLNEEKPVEVKCYRKDCAGTQRPDPKGKPGRVCPKIRKPTGKGDMW